MPPRCPSGEGRPGARHRYRRRALLVQLTAIGYAIKLIFEEDRLWLVFGLIAIMVVFGAFAARSRAKKVPDALSQLLVALALAGGTTLGLVIALGIFEPTARYLVPVGGMVIGNAMTASAVALNRLGEEMTESRRPGSRRRWRSARPPRGAAPIVRRGLRSGMITLVDSTKTTGLIFFPGTMVGMLLAGASPTDAVRLQLILLYALLGSVAIAGLVATGSPTETSSPRPNSCASRVANGALYRRLGRPCAERTPSLVLDQLGQAPGSPRALTTPAFDPWEQGLPAKAGRED